CTSPSTAFLADMSNEIKGLLRLVRVGSAKLKKLIGRAEWVAGIIPYMKAIIMRLWLSAANAPLGRIGA
ncbi:MAG: hypothetical protein ACKPKO_52215, partial [Candidatus Fonsibacter sp.]